MKKYFRNTFAVVFLLTALLFSALPVSALTQYSPIIMNVVNCNSFITLRESPSTNAAEITKIPLHAKVTYVSAARNGFYKIQYNGYTGYSLSRYLGYLNIPSEDEMDEDFHNADNPWIVVDCDEFITLRDMGNASGTEILKLPRGAIVDYLRSENNGYCKVSFRGVQGYALEKYLQPFDGLTGEDAIFTMKVVKCRESITLRNTPSTSGKEILQIPLGATVDFIDFSTNGFYKVSYCGWVGYALSRYLE